MRRITPHCRHGDRGFTLVELLIVIAVLGVLAGVAVPGVSGFITAGNVRAANTEAANVEEAARAYFGAYGSFPGNSQDLAGDFVAGTLKAKYHFNSNTGKIGSGTKYVDKPPGGNGWRDNGLNFSIATGTWSKGVETPETASNGTLTKP